MQAALDFLKGKKTYLLVIVYVVLRLVSGEGIEDLDLDKIEDLVLAAMIGTLRAGVAKIGK